MSGQQIYGITPANGAAENYRHEAMGCRIKGLTASIFKNVK